MTTQYTAIPAIRIENLTPYDLYNLEYKKPKPDQSLFTNRERSHTYPQDSFFSPKQAQFIHFESNSPQRSNNNNNNNSETPQVLQSKVEKIFKKIRDKLNF